MSVNRRRESSTLSVEMRRYFLDQIDMPVEAILLPNDRIKDLWLAHAGELVAEYVRDFPGERPFHWWRHSAPRAKHLWRGHYVEMERPRLLIRGSGRMRHDVSAYAIAFFWGLPFVSQVDPNDVPVFESQAAYLRRNRLFLDGEEARLDLADFAAEPLDKDLWTTADI